MCEPLANAAVVRGRLSVPVDSSKRAPDANPPVPQGRTPQPDLLAVAGIDAGKDRKGHPMSNTSLAMAWAALAGVVLLLAGAVGFLNTSLVGTSENALLRTDTVHNLVHVLTGLVALTIAFGTKGTQQVNAVIGFGVLYVIIFVAVLVSPNLFGLFSVSANAPIHLIHAAVAVVSLGVGLMARSGNTAMAR